MQIVTIKLIKKVIKPIIELFVVFGISYRSLDIMIKEIYVSISSKKFGKRGRIANNSRISMATGISRREVRKIKSRLLSNSDSQSYSVSPLSKVIKIWINDYQYIDPKNQPKKLDYKNTKNSFCDLIKKARINATPNSALQEFKRLGLVKINEDKKICLLQNAVINDSNEEIFHASLSSHLNKSQYG